MPVGDYILSRLECNSSSDDNYHDRSCAFLMSSCGFSFMEGAAKACKLSKEASESFPFDDPIRPGQCECLLAIDSK
jgi:hypothetical protein